MNPAGLIQLDYKLALADRIHNLHQVFNLLGRIRDVISILQSITLMFYGSRDSTKSIAFVSMINDAERDKFKLYHVVIFKGRMANTADSKRIASAQEAIGETATQSVVVAVDRYSEMVT